MSTTFERFVAVPKSKEGKEAYKTTSKIRNDVEYFDISDSEFDKIISNNTIESFYKKAGVLIGDYESDYIPAEKIGKCIDILNKSKSLKNSIFFESFRKAEEYGFGLYTEF